MGENSDNWVGKAVLRLKRGLPGGNAFHRRSFSVGIRPPRSAVALPACDYTQYRCFGAREMPGVIGVVIGREIAESAIRW